MFDAREFAARLANRQDRWSLLKDFVAERHTPLQEDDGYSREELDAAEQRLGLKLPIALREWDGLVGKREDIIAMQNFLASPEELEIMDENNLLVFYCENQQVVEWGIRELISLSLIRRFGWTTVVFTRPGRNLFGRTIRFLSLLCRRSFWKHALTRKSFRLWAESLHRLSERPNKILSLWGFLTGTGLPIQPGSMAVMTYWFKPLGEKTCGCK